MRASFSDKELQQQQVQPGAAERDAPDGIAASLLQSVAVAAAVPKEPETQSGDLDLEPSAEWILLGRLGTPADLDLILILRLPAAAEYAYRLDDLVISAFPESDRSPPDWIDAMHAAGVGSVRLAARSTS